MEAFFDPNDTKFSVECSFMAIFCFVFLNSDRSNLGSGSKTKVEWIKIGE